MAPTVIPPRANFAWDKLAFDLYPTAGYSKYVYSNGTWGDIQWIPGSEITIPVGSVGLNYGASVFEGLKAFRQPDGQVKIFRPKDNAARLNHSAAVVSMPPIEEEKFLEAVALVVGRNLDLVPKHAAFGASGSMYIRPLMFASGANLILNAPSEFTFLVYVTPTGSLYGTAGTKAPAVDAYILEDFDRSAPKGVGHAKLAGNYAPTFQHMIKAKKAGYAITLHLDSATRTNIDEFSTSNFLAIKTENDAAGNPVLVVPTSESILGSITTKAIIDIATSFGWVIERRVVPFEEVLQGGFREVCACGTAAAITPIKSITYHPSSSPSTEKVSIGDGVNAGEGFLRILEELTGIQSGVREDKWSWCWPEEGVDGSV